MRLGSVSLTKRLTKYVRAIILLGVVILATALSALFLDHMRQTVLPKPTGLYAVGRTILSWSDTANGDRMAPQPGTRRQLVAWISYPADPDLTKPLSPYMPEAWRNAFEHRVRPLVTHFVNRDITRVRTNSISDVPVSLRQRSYPVVMMRAGLAALTVQYTALAEDLASHGYVVVGVDAPYRTLVTVLSDGSVVERARRNDAELLSGVRQEQLAIELVDAWSADLSFALDRLGQLDAPDAPGLLAGRLDLSRIGVFGHSLGGATTLQFCHDNPRCTAGIDIDGAPLGKVIGEGVDKPFMLLLGDHSSEPTLETQQVEANLERVYDRLPQVHRSFIRIPGSSHFLFSDAAFTQLPLATAIAKAIGVIGVGGPRQIALTRRYIIQFFDRNLAG